MGDKSIDDKFAGVASADGKYYNIADADNERRPFKAYLDVGLVRTTTGNRVFGAMKGACDGGLNIPHSQQRFPGFRIEKAEVVTDKREKKTEEQGKAKEVFSVEEHKEHIFGVHVQEYYDKLKEEDKGAFERQFKGWTKALNGKSFEKVYAAAHKAIRDNPECPKKTEKKITRTVVQAGPKLIQKNSLSKKNTWLREKKISKDERREKIQA